MELKDFEPQKITLFQSEWEEIMSLFEYIRWDSDPVISKKASIMKYKLQCRIDAAVRDKKWV